MRTILRSRRGEAALLEATVILPLVLLVLAALMGISLYLCDTAVAQTLAEKYASLAVQETRIPGAGAAFVSREQNEKNVWNQNTVAFLGQDRRDTEFFSGAPEYSVLRQALTAEAGAASLLRWETVSCEISYEDSHVSPSVRVTVTGKAPGGRILSRIYPAYERTAVMRVGDCTETVRNVDLILDIVDDVAARSEKNSGFTEMISGFFKGKTK